METLVKKSDIRVQKYKFFINRIVIYFIFFLFPLLLPHIIKLNLFFQSIALLSYMTFMGGQWYLLGKEIDHRLRIYYRANSSMDRFLYRLLIGSLIVLLYFNFISLFPNSISNILYWSFFVLLGLFYSWPTRGKIIEESMSDQFSEFKFLDSFEKTVLYLTFSMFLVTLPEIPLFENIDALKLYFDPFEKIHQLQWNFLSVNYLPFLNHPHLFNISWSFHFYFYGMAFYLIAIYGTLRFFVSRRLSILGTFAAISTWSIPKLLDVEIISIYTTSYSVIWIWAFLWSTKSSTYRSGLFVGLLNFYGIMINANFFLLYPIQLMLTYFFFLPEKTNWYKKQWLKYNFLGIFLCTLALLGHTNGLNLFNGFGINSFYSFAQTTFWRKAFYSLSPIGLFLILSLLFNKKSGYFKTINLDKFLLKEISISFLVIFLLGLFVEKDLIRGFSLYWLFVFLSLIPLEWIFQSISRLRSKRNVIYIMYILVCLLDSHFEGRLRIIGKLFFDEEVLKFINQM